jgi:N-acetylmuramoyl-L-alanine amidase
MKKLLLLLPLVWLAACSTPQFSGGGGGSTRDVMGHRPGPQNFRTVIIDAGHGGKDSGAISAVTGDLEKNLAMDVAQRVKSLLGGFNTVLLRQGDHFIDLDQRVVMANQYGDGVLVSIHFNSGPSRLAGPETFYWRVDSYSLAARIQRNLSSLASDENGNRGLVRRRLRLTRNPEIPSVLVECGYLSNYAEARKSSDSGYRQSLAVAIANAIREQAAYGDAGMGSLPPPINAPMSRPTDARE